MLPETEFLPSSVLMALIEATNDAIMITSADQSDGSGHVIHYANPALCRISGYTREEIIGKTPRILQGPGTSRQALDRIRAALKQGQDWHEELLNYSKNGTPYWVDIHIVPLQDDAGIIQYFGAIQRDVTEKRSAVEQLERLALADVLTGLGNRAALHKHMAALPQVNADHPEPHCMLLFDLDGFKGINDTLGHLAGDEILRHFAAYVASSLRRDDFMARLGGDEFIVILKGYSSTASRGFADHVLTNLASMKVAGAEKIGVSVGIAFFQSGEEMDTIIGRADTALYLAKGAGKGAVHVYSRRVPA